MARHRQRTRATHTLTATRDEQTGSGGAGGKEPTYEPTTVVEDVLVRLDAGGRSFVREDTGEVLSRDPVVAGSTHDLAKLNEGDAVTLEALDPEGETWDDLEVRRRVPTHDRRARARELTIELERAR